MDEVPHSFTIKCTRALPKIPLSSATVGPHIDFISLASIVPCGWCGGRCVVDEPFPGANQPMFRLMCTQCGRTWKVVVGGDDATLELRISIPDHAPVRWNPAYKRPTNDIAYDEYVRDMLRFGEETIPFKEWANLQ